MTSNSHVLILYLSVHSLFRDAHNNPVEDPGGRGGHGPSPGPMKIGHKKDGRQRWPHRFHVSRPPPPYPAAGSAIVTCHTSWFMDNPPSHDG